MSLVSYFLSPANMWSLLATASSASVDADYLAAWATDGRPGFPIRLTGTTGSIALTKSALVVDFVGLFHHNLVAGVTGVFSGDLSKTVTVPTWPANGVPYNAYGILSAPVSVTNVSVAIATNNTAIVVGEVIVGKLTALSPTILHEGHQFLEHHYVAAPANPLSGIPPYSERARSRELTGRGYYTQTMLDTILEWFDAQDSQPYPVPSVIILDSGSTKAAQLVMLAEPTYVEVTGGMFDVALHFTEIPRTRW